MRSSRSMSFGMILLMSVLSAFLGSIGGYFLGVYRGKTSSRGEADHLYSALLHSLRAENERLKPAAETANSLDFELKEMVRETAELKGAYERQKNRANAFFKKIEEVISERDTWNQLYLRMMASNDAAQAMMMREIQRIALIYKRDVGKDLALDKTIDEVRRAWTGDQEASVAAIQEFMAKNAEKQTAAVEISEGPE